jgi:copper chaperone NosL
MRAGFPVTRRGGLLLVSLFVGAAALGCSAPAPQPIHYDSDACDHCRMTISTPVFATQLVTRTGKVYRFDDPQCVVDFLSSGRVTASEVHSIWANDHASPDTRVRVEDAVFVASDRIRAPMNGHLAVFASEKEAKAFQASVGGTLQRWREVSRREPS